MRTAAGPGWPLAGASSDLAGVRVTRRPEPAVPARGVVVAGAAAVVVVMWAIAAAFRVTHPHPGTIDRGWDALAGARDGSVVHAVAQALAVLGTGLPAVLLTAVVAVLLGAQRGWSWTVLTVVASLVSELDVLGLKALAMRARPDSAFGIGTSFPSGHTANAALLGVVVILLVRRLAVRVPVAAFVVAMAWSRTALHAHWLTDVVGGALIGAAAAVLLHAGWCAVLHRVARRRRRAARRRPVPARPGVAHRLPG